MSSIPSSRDFSLNAPERSLEAARSAVEGASSFERELVVRHAEEVLDGQKLDLQIVALAGGLQKFEAELDYCENARRWRQHQADAPDLLTRVQRAVRRVFRLR